MRTNNLAYPGLHTALHGLLCLRAQCPYEAFPALLVPKIVTKQFQILYESNEKLRNKDSFVLLLRERGLGIRKKLIYESLSKSSSNLNNICELREIKE